jgi:soluble lytic murein transglycosylase-like protein
MKNGPALVLKGTILGSLLLGLMGWLLGGKLTLTPETEIAYAAAPSQLSPQEQASDQVAEPPTCQVSAAYPESILQWCELITRQAHAVQLPPDLIAAVMLQESGGDPAAYSSSGAVGLMQVMPRDGLAAEFDCLNGPCFASRPTIDELLNPAFNLEYATGMLAGLIERTGSHRQALKSYGPMDVGYAYADTVLAIFDRYR